LSSTFTCIVSARMGQIVAQVKILYLQPSMAKREAEWPRSLSWQIVPSVPIDLTTYISKVSSFSFTYNNLLRHICDELENVSD
jgi:hypothetical protein